MIAATRRVILAPIVAVCALVPASLGALALLAAPVAHATIATAAKPNPLANPKHNTAPSRRFIDACSSMGKSKAANDKCDSVALHDFDDVRKKEGLGRMTLPGDFDKLSVRLQLLAISNIERVDRGRRPVLGLSKSLNKLAVMGAKDDEDPPFPNPFTGTSGGANWAGAGNSALLDDFYWMYDDGPGSFNIDCQHKGDPGCWGHRRDIIQAYDSRLVMGAAAAYNTNFGTSMTEEFIGGDRSDKVNVSPSWHAIAATFPLRVAISASQRRVASGAAVTVTGKVTTHSNAKVARQLVELQRRVGSGGAWHNLTSRRSGPHGVVSVRLHPSASAMYRFVALAKNGSHRGASSAVRIAIA
jgi:hypothetical protein